MKKPILNNYHRRVIGIFITAILLMTPEKGLFAHGYLFSMTNEEMRDNIEIEVNRNFLLIRYESLFLGQIAPHVRLMIDSDADNRVTRTEIDQFFSLYKESLNNEEIRSTLLIDGNPVKLQLVAAFGPTLTKDSLLAPLYTELLFSISEFELAAGAHDLVIDPRILFESGTHFLRLARQKVEFTVEQEKAIGRFLQIQMKGGDGIVFTSTYPGRLKNKENMAQIYGVFFDKTPLESAKDDYPPIRVTFRVD